MNGAWFEAMEADARNRPEVYRVLGFADLRLVVEETDGDAVRCFGLVLDGYDVEFAGELDDVDAFRPDATVTGPREAWDEMAANIVANGGADGTHTLNAMSIAELPLRVWSADPVGRDKFFRYAETLQVLFDSLAGAAITA
ncbi:MAG: hypothetical protein KJ056_10815 [Acidimicrobiia bacterium]|nr:hypothetical protein [Acidimicrobiia bacterium]